jgi:hypothetical protein
MLFALNRKPRKIVVINFNLNEFAKALWGVFPLYFWPDLKARDYPEASSAHPKMANPRSAVSTPDRISKNS